MPTHCRVQAAKRFGRASAAVRYLSAMTFAKPRKRRPRLRGLCVLPALCAMTANVATAANAPDRCIVTDRAIGCISERATIDLATPRKDAGAMRDLVRQKLESGQCRLFGYGERVYLVSGKDTERTAIHRVGDRTTYWLPASWTRPAGECEANASSASLQAKLGMPGDALPQQTLSTTPPEDIDRNSVVERGDYAYRSDDDRSGRVYRSNDDRSERVYRDEDDRSARVHRDDVPLRREGSDRQDYADRNSDFEYGGDDWRRREWDRRNPAYSRNGHADEQSRYRDDDGRSASDNRHPPRGLPPSHAPLASSTYAHMHPGRDVPGAAPCVYKPVMTREDLAACREPRR
jgi:hypothetical protein